MATEYHYSIPHRQDSVRKKGCLDSQVQRTNTQSLNIKNEIPPAKDEYSSITLDWYGFNMATMT